MKHRRKQFLSVLLSLALILGLMPWMSMTAYADISSVEIVTAGNSTTYKDTDENFTITCSAADGDGMKLGWGDINISAKDDDHTIRKVELTIGWYPQYAQNVVSDKGTITLPEDLDPSTGKGGIITIDGVNSKTLKLSNNNNNAPQLKKVKIYYGESAHTHSFTYSASGAIITATCGNTGCDLTDSKAILTIKAPTLTYVGQTGEGISAATLDGKDAFNTATGKSVAETNIKYVGRDGTNYEESATAPTGAGKYTAKITLSGVKTGAGDDESVTASVDYSIGYSVTFNSNGGSEVPMQVVEPGETAARPQNNPTKEGNIFGDWYEDSNFSRTYSFGNSVTENTTIYAKWGEHEVKWVIGGYIKRDVFTGTAPAADSNTSVNLMISFFYDTLVPGGTFAGWYTETDNSGNVTYTTQSSYPVTLHENDGTINAGNVTSYIYGTGATLPTDVTRAKYDFGGWYDNSGLTGNAVTQISTTATGSKEFWAKWTAVYAVPATVTANNRSYDETAKPLVTVTGTATGGEMQYALGTATEATEQYTTSIPTATDAGTYYVWYKVKGNENHNDADPKVVTVKIATPSTYIVTVTNDGHGTGAANPASGVTGTEVTLTNTPAEGYQFKEWQVISGDVTVTDNKLIIGTANVEVKAIFEALPPDVYTVTVTNDGHGTGAANPASGVTGTEVTLTNTPAEGYQFKEWQVISGGVTVADNKFTIGTANVEVKAIFEALPPNVYSVTVTNDGHGTGAANPASGVTGTEVTLTNTPAAGYQFKEWQVISGGVTIANNTFKIGTANVEVKAVFEVKSAGSETGKTETKSGAPVITASNMAEVVKSVAEAIRSGKLAGISEEVKKALSKPGAVATLTLVSSPLSDSEVPAADKTALDAEAQANGYDGYQAFDLTLKLTVTDPETNQTVTASIHLSSTDVTFTLQIPEGLKKTSRTFYLLGCHDGKVSNLASTTAGTITGKSKQFSTYAIAYKDAEEPPKPVSSTFYFKKVWEGSAEKSIDFTLYSADGNVIHQGFEKHVLSAREWSYNAVFTDAGSCYVIEKPVPGYITRYVNVGEYAGITDRCYNGGTIINKKIPKTGDEASLLLWAGMLLTGAAGLTVALTVNKRRKAHK